MKVDPADVIADLRKALDDIRRHMHPDCPIAEARYDGKLPASVWLAFDECMRWDQRVAALAIGAPDPAELTDADREWAEEIARRMEKDPER